MSHFSITREIKIKKLKDNAIIPKYATKDSAGFDLCACIDDNITLRKGRSLLIKTGLAIALPEGYEAQIRPRSGLAFKYGVTVLNSPGTIDADYRGEVGVLLINHGHKDFIITPDMRIAQMVIAEYQQASFNVVDNLEDTVRGAGGFGSTGV